MNESAPAQPGEPDVADGDETGGPAEADSAGRPAAEQGDGEDRTYGPL